MAIGQFVGLVPEQKAAFLYLHNKLQLTKGSIPSNHVVHNLTSIAWIRMLLSLAIQIKGKFGENCSGNVESKRRPEVKFVDSKG